MLCHERFLDQFKIKTTLGYSLNWECCNKPPCTARNYGQKESMNLAHLSLSALGELGELRLGRYIVLGGTNHNHLAKYIASRRYERVYE